MGVIVELLTKDRSARSQQSVKRIFLNVMIHYADAALSGWVFWSPRQPPGLLIEPIRRARRLFDFRPRAILLAVLSAHANDSD
jgi:hypothetical protein